MMASSPFSLSLQVSDIDISRGGRVVATGVGFKLSPGEAIVIRGDNGTGKTSLLRTIAGFSPALQGQISFSEGDQPLDEAEIRATQLHWLGGDDGLAEKLTVRETLSFWSGLYGAGPWTDVPTRVGLQDKLASPTGRLSTGQRRRLGLGRLLLAPKALWLLDEPLSGLDASGQSLLLDAIADHRRQGGIVVMVSHDAGLPDAPVLRLLAAEAA